VLIYACMPQDSGKERATNHVSFVAGWQAGKTSTRSRIVNAVRRGHAMRGEAEPNGDKERIG